MKPHARFVNDFRLKLHGYRYISTFVIINTLYVIHNRLLWMDVYQHKKQQQCTFMQPLYMYFLAGSPLVKMS